MSFTDVFRNIQDIVGKIQKLSTTVDALSQVVVTHLPAENHSTDGTPAGDARKAAIDDIIKFHFPNGYKIDPKSGRKIPRLPNDPVDPTDLPIPTNKK